MFQAFGFIGEICKLKLSTFRFGQCETSVTGTQHRATAHKEYKALLVP